MPKSAPKRPRRNMAAYDALLELLLSGELKPGEIINRRQIAARLDMSVAPVLEAMLRLEGDGFLEVLPNKGTRVCAVRLDEVRGNLEVREALEGQAARIWDADAFDAAAKDLARLAREVDRATHRTRAAWEAEVAFHQALVDVAACAALSRAHRRVMRIGLFHQLNAILTPAEAKRTGHAAFLKKLRAASAGDAEKLVRAHVWSGKGQLRAGT